MIGWRTKPRFAPRPPPATLGRCGIYEFGIELTIAAATAESFVRARRRFAGLGKHGVQVTVRRADGFAALPVHTAAGPVIER
jgi:hypothetical protein